MSEQPKDGGPAFPTQERTGNSFAGDDSRLHSETLAHGGMSLRDWFAGQALAGDAANNEEGCFSHKTSDAQLLNQAQLYYRIADAMLAARAKAPS